MQVGTQSDAHDATTDQHNIDVFILFRCNLLRDAKQA